MSPGPEVLLTKALSSGCHIPIKVTDKALNNRKVCFVFIDEPYQISFVMSVLFCDFMDPFLIVWFKA